LTRTELFRVHRVNVGFALGVGLNVVGVAKARPLKSAQIARLSTLFNDSGETP
jgi:hypothetical protein